MKPLEALGRIGSLVPFIPKKDQPSVAERESLLEALLRKHPLTTRDVLGNLICDLRAVTFTDIGKIANAYQRLTHQFPDDEPSVSEVLVLANIKNKRAGKVTKDPFYQKVGFNYRNFKSEYGEQVPASIGFRLDLRQLVTFKFLEARDISKKPVTEVDAALDSEAETDAWAYTPYRYDSEMVRYYLLPVKDIYKRDIIPLLESGKIIVAAPPGVSYEIASIRERVGNLSSPFRLPTLSEELKDLM